MKGASGTKRRAIGWYVKNLGSGTLAGVGTAEGWGWSGVELGLPIPLIEMVEKKILFSIWLTLVHKIHYLQKLTSCRLFFKRMLTSTQTM